MMTGRATATGTLRYAGRFPQAAPGHFRLLQGLTASCIGLGTYPGADDEHTDRSYTAAIERALALGCNMFDTAVAYRNQRSERVIGRSLSHLIARRAIARDEVIIASKAGFLPFDSGYSGGVARYYEDTFIQHNIVTAANFVAPGHCIAPEFVRHQIEMSRQNLDCATIDIYYLHNPETQHRAIDARGLYGRIRAAFAALEHAVAHGHIGMYGVSTWSAFRVPSDSPEHLSLAELMACARDVGGEDHHFRIVMLPVHGMADGASLGRQKVGAASELESFLQRAQDFGLSVVASSPLNGGRLARAAGEPIAQNACGVRTHAQRALDVVRGIQGVTTALVGMSNPAHVSQNLELAKGEMAMNGQASVASALADVGETHVEQSRYTEAVVSFTQSLAAAELALKVNAGDIIAAVDKAHALLNLGRVHALRWEEVDAAEGLEQSVTACDDALLIAPVCTAARYIQGRALLSLGRLATAVSQHEKAIEFYARSIRCHEQALAEADAVTPPASTSAMLLSLGRLHAGTGNQQGALDYYRLAIQSCDDHMAARDATASILTKAKALTSIARLETKLGRHDSARDACRDALDVLVLLSSETSKRGAVQRDKGNTLLLLGEVELACGHDAAACPQFEAAVAAYDEAIRYAKDDVIAHSNRAIALARIAALDTSSSTCTDTERTYEASIAACDEALRLAPRSVYAHNTKGGALAGLANLRSSRSQHREAVEHFEAALTEFRMSQTMAPTDRRIREFCDRLETALAPI